MTKNKAKAEEVVLTKREVLTSELGSIIGKTPQWVRQLTRDGILKQVSRGKYILGDAIQAYILHASGGKEDDGKPRFIDEKTEHESIKKEKASLELRKLKGELHESADIEKLMTDMILSAKNRLQALPQRLAPKLANEPAGFIEQVINEEITAALSSLKSYDPIHFTDKGG